MIITCENCGKVHNLVETKLKFRDRDSIECLDCDKELYSWNGACTWSYEKPVVNVVVRVYRPGTAELLGKYLDREGCVTPHGAPAGHMKHTQIRVNGKLQYRHRLTWEAEVGPIPEGMTIDHLCRTAGCCKIEHLEVVTSRVNTQRGQNHHLLKTHCGTCGLELTEDNIYRRPDAPHWRGCRNCRRVATRKWKASRG